MSDCSSVVEIGGPWRPKEAESHMWKPILKTLGGGAGGVLVQVLERNFRESKLYTSHYLTVPALQTVIAHVGSRVMPRMAPVMHGIVGASWYQAAAGYEATAAAEKSAPRAAGAEAKGPAALVAAAFDRVNRTQQALRAV